jgi:signal peptidase I
MTEPASAPAGNASAQGLPKKKEESLVRFVAKLFLLALVLRSFVFSPFTIPSESMLPRLMNGDYLLAAKWSYGYTRYSLPFALPLIPGRIFAATPERGDIVIFKHPADKTDVIKRVIGLPGDSVELREGTLFINGEEVAKRRIADLAVPVSPNTSCLRGFERAEPDGSRICVYPRFRETLPGGNRSYEVLDLGAGEQDSFGPVAVPEGRLFLLGDNRDNSVDGRFAVGAGAGIGLVPEENLIGKATIMIWSTDGSAEWVKPWAWLGALRAERVGGAF